MRHRELLLVAFSLFLGVGLVHCGGKGTANRNGDEAAGSGGSAASAGSAAAGSGGSTGGSGGTTSGTGGQPPVPCDPPDAKGYVPSWAPPRAIPGSCTTTQIAEAYALCEDAKSYDEEQCRAFRLAPANTDCLGCIYSALDAKESHAILLLHDGYPLANVGGCIALLDGDLSDDSCGARTRAIGVCQYSSCLDACPGPTSMSDWDACLTTAHRKACAEYTDAASCTALPRYTVCQHTSFKDFYTAYGDLFCGAGPPETTPVGAAGAAGASP